MQIQVEVARGTTRTPSEVEVPDASDVRAVVRRLGHSPEGVAVLIDGRPVALDRVVGPGEKLVVVPTFSGG